MIYQDFNAFRASGFTPKVCIVGSGPAGISLALRLEKHRIPCLIVEAGGAEVSAQGQDALRGTVVGDSYFELHISRLRCLGGTSGHWGGWSRRMEASDFLPHPAIPHSGWPIRKADLDPFAADTSAILELPPLPADQPLGKDLVEIEIQRRKAVRFGTKYRDHLAKSSSIGVLLNSPVTQFVPVAGRIESVKLAAAAGTDRRIQAETFVLCAGGIENSRVLLWSNQLSRGGVVPQPAALGRYWMEHPHHTTGRALVFTSSKLRVPGGVRFYAPTPAFLAAQGVGNFALRLYPGSQITNTIIKDGLCVAPEFFTRMAQRFKEGLACGAEVHLAWEQVPVAANRIELDTEVDATGMPHSRLYWKKTELDRKTAEVAMQALGSYFAQTDQGRVQLSPWLEKKGPFPTDDERAGFHHMGGTRMAASPADGVVDGDCRVFGVQNLYIGGSSLFPTSGHANPTYTLVQLALRLGDHLGGKFARA